MIESSNYLFHGLDRVKVVEAEAMLKPFHAEPGQMLYRDGENPIGLYLIGSGYVEVHHSSLEGERTPELRAVRGPGDYFGEMALIDRRRRHITVVAIERVRGHFFPEDAFERFILREPRFLITLTRDILARNSQHDSELIRELVRAKNAAERFIDRLKALRSTAETINSTLDLNDLLHLILREAVHHTEADKGTIYLVDHKSNELFSRVQDGSMTREIRLPLGTGIAGHVAQSGEAVNIPDAYDDDRFNPEIDRKTGYRTKSMLTMPMRDPERKIVGVIQLLNHKDGPFERDDEEFISAMGVQASIAIEKARLAEEMVHSESLASVGRLAAGIIHDFKNPMAIIRGYAQMLEMPLEEKERKEYLNIITSQVDRLVGMSREVLDFARGESTIEPVKTLVAPYIEELCKTIREDYKEQGITVEAYIANDQLEASFDTDRLARVFFNLVGNARDAMPEGGTLTVEVRSGSEEWTLTVQDTGVGIPAERLDRIFDPFATFDKSHGTGLGLAIVRKIVQSHGGAIEVSSEEGVGTIFTMSFPMHGHARQGDEQPRDRHEVKEEKDTEKASVDKGGNGAPPE